MSRRSCTVDFEPVGKRVETGHGITLLEAARSCGIILASTCGGAGSCGQCRVKVLNGKVSSPEKEEKVFLTRVKLEQGYRLACRTRALGNVKIYVEKRSLLTAHHLQLQGDPPGDTPAPTVDPLIRAVDSDTPPPAIDDPRSDFARITAPLGDSRLQADPDVVRQLTTRGRSAGWGMTLFQRDGEIIGAAPTETKPLGMAVDLGTTKVAAEIVDLTTGGQLAVAGAMNPQIGFGEDVISRITYAYRTTGGARLLARQIQETVNDLLGKLSEKAGVARTDVTDICIVGNTAMIHLLLELPVLQLGTAPYVAACNAPFDIKARDLGLAAAPGAYVHILPSIGGFVGGDHLAMILAGGIDCCDCTTLGIDIGTNTEIVLARPSKNEITVTSCASGPALEGAHISAGMRAASGAIEGVSLDRNEINLKTVDNAPPVGLCGSGLIDAVAELRRQGLINRRGRFDRENHLIRPGDSGPEFVIASDSGGNREIIITQHDINAVQLAKGAIRVGLEILLETSDTVSEAVEDVIIAGAFGASIDVRSATDIGLLPPFSNARYKKSGNLAIVGARQVLTAKRLRRRALRLAGRIRHRDLTSHPDYKRQFALGMLFPEFDPK